MNRTDACSIRVIASELVQSYVGEGARMVRELFQVTGYIPEQFKHLRDLFCTCNYSYFLGFAFLMRVSSCCSQMARSKKTCIVF